MQRPAPRRSLYPPTRPTQPTPLPADTNAQGNTALSPNIAPKTAAYRNIAAYRNAGAFPNTAAYPNAAGGSDRPIIGTQNCHCAAYPTGMGRNGELVSRHAI